MRRYDYEPIDVLLGGNIGTQAEILGVTRRTVHRWKANGLSREQAERVADTVRSLSYELWPEILDDAIDAAKLSDEERRQAKNEYRRRYYLANRERELAHRRDYYERNRDRILKERRRSYERSRATA